MDKGRGTKEKRVYISQRAFKKKEMHSKIGTSWCLSEIPIIWNELVLWNRGCFIVVELSTKGVVQVNYT